MKNTVIVISLVAACCLGAFFFVKFVYMLIGFCLDDEPSGNIYKNVLLVGLLSVSLGILLTILSVIRMALDSLNERWGLHHFSWDIYKRVNKLTTPSYRNRLSSMIPRLFLVGLLIALVALLKIPGDKVGNWWTSSKAKREEAALVLVKTDLLQRRIGGELQALPAETSSFPDRIQPKVIIMERTIAPLGGGDPDSQYVVSSLTFDLTPNLEISEKPSFKTIVYIDYDLQFVAPYGGGGKGYRWVCDLRIADVERGVVSKQFISFRGGDPPGVIHGPTRGRSYVGTQPSTEEIIESLKRLLDE